MRPWIALVALVAFACGGSEDRGGMPQPHKPGAAPIREGAFVEADGAGFRVGDEPFRFVGANAAMMHGEAMREAAPRLLDAVRADGIRVVRVWAFGEADDDGRRWRRDYAFRLGPEEWVEESFVHLDRVLAEARARDVRVILVLANRWADYGGLSQYARWIGVEPRRRHLLHAEVGVVLRDERVRALYRAHVEKLVTRRNTITGVSYRDDPTIFAWELVNELTTGTCATADAVRSFVDDMSRFVRERDPNHLIGAGHGGYKSALSRETWCDVHALPAIGYADHHAYPEHVRAIAAPEELTPWIADRAHLAREVLDKPLVVGEIGFARDDPRFAPRAEWLAAFFRLTDEAGAAGVMPWIYRPWDERDDRHGIWAWGPRARESAPVRARLKWWSSRWAGRAPERAVDAPPREPSLRDVAPYVEGTWEDLGRGRHRVVVDPWALGEGCAREGEEAWADYVLQMPRGGAPARFAVTALGPRSRAAAPLDVRVEVDGVHVGTWDGRGPFQPEPGALAEAFAESAGVRWVRLSSATEAGAALLRRFTSALPAGDTLTIEVRW